MSNRKVWWRCARGHEYQAMIVNRAKLNGTGCPQCAPQSSAPQIRLFCELATVFPNCHYRHRIYGTEIDIFVANHSLAIEYDGARWHADPEADRRKNAHLAERGIRTLRVRESPLKPLQAPDIVVPRRVQLSIENVQAVLRAVCTLTELSKSEALRAERYEHRTAFAADVRFGELLALLPGPPPGASLSDLHTDLATEWHYEKNGSLLPSQFYPASNQKVWWCCAAGHSWQATIAHRVSGTGCAKCVGRKPWEMNNLAVHFPAIAAEWHPTRNGDLRPEHVLPTSRIRVHWICPRCSGEYELPVAKRTAAGRGCPHSAGRLVTPLNSLLAKRPDLLAEWDWQANGKLRPDEVTVGSTRKVAWACHTESAHRWVATVGSRTRQGTGCPYCAGNLPTPDENLAIRFPELAKEWHPTRNHIGADQVRPFSNLSYWWRCLAEERHEWQANVSVRTAGGKPCPFCRKDLRESRSLQNLRPDVAAQWHPVRNAPLTPRDVTAGSDSRVWWLCGICGNEWQTAVGNRTRLSSGCPACRSRNRKDTKQSKANEPQV